MEIRTQVHNKLDSIMLTFEEYDDNDNHSEYQIWMPLSTAKEIVEKLTKSILKFESRQI